MVGTRMYNRIMDLILLSHFFHALTVALRDTTTGDNIGIYKSRKKGVCSGTFPALMNLTSSSHITISHSIKRRMPPAIKSFRGYLSSMP